MAASASVAAEPRRVRAGWVPTGALADGIRAASTETSADAAASQARTAATACRTVSATALVIERFMPVRRGVSAIATRSAVTASVIVAASATPASVSSAMACASRPRPLAPLPSGPGSGSASRMASGIGLGRVREGAQRGRVQLAEHLPQRRGGALAAGGDGGVGGEYRLEAEQVARGGLGDRGEHAGLQRAGQADGAPLGRRGLDLVGGLVVAEPLGVVVGRVVVGVREVATGGGEELGDDVVVTVRRDADGLQPVGAIGEQRAELGVPGGVVS